jgi:hypothetical protein
VRPHQAVELLIDWNYTLTQQQQMIASASIHASNNGESHQEASQNQTAALAKCCAVAMTTELTPEVLSLLLVPGSAAMHIRKSFALNRF